MGAAANGGAEAVEIIIGGRPAQIEMPGSYCALSAFNPVDARLIRFLIAVNRGVNTVHIANAVCAQLVDWRDGGDVTLLDYGYVATPILLENTLVDMARSDYINARAEPFKQQGVFRLERGFQEGEERVRDLLSRLEVGATESFGIISEDANAIYLGLVQKIDTGSGDPIVLLGTFANTTLDNRATTMRLFTEFSDDALESLVARNRDVVDRTIKTNEP